MANKILDLLIIYVYRNAEFVNLLFIGMFDYSGKRCTGWGFRCMSTTNQRDPYHWSNVFISRFVEQKNKTSLIFYT